MTDNISLLICGQIRNREEFERNLDRYLQWLRGGAIERIVFSGWISDMGAHADLMYRMAEEGIDVALSEEPLIKSFGYTLHQTKSLHHGLARFRGDEWVLKSRTDKVNLDFDIEMLRERITGQAPVGAASPFSCRVLVQGAQLFQPFFVNDMMFAGKVQDLRLLAHHDLWYVRDHCLLNTEQIIFFSAFRAASPYSEAFFSVNPGLQHGNPTLAHEIYSFLLSHPLYQHAQREYMAALASSFTIGLPRDLEEAPTTSAHWADMLDLTAQVSGTVVDAVNTGLRVGLSNSLPERLLAMPLSAHDARTLDGITPEIDERQIRDLQDDLSTEIGARWPDLLNLPKPDTILNGVRIVSTRISLVG